LEDSPGDLAGLFPEREASWPEPGERSVIDLTRQERLVVTSGEVPAEATDPAGPTEPPGPAVLPGFPVELPHPSARREQLLLTAVSWLIVLFTTLLGALGGLTYSSIKGADYTATSSVIVSPANPSSTAQSNPAGFASAYAQVALETPVLQPALADAGISMSVDDARKQLEVRVPPDAALISIDATAGSGADAAALANAAAKGIASYGTARQAETGYRVTQFTVASAPTAPNGPDRALSVIVGALIGLAVGGGIVLVVRRTRRNSVGAGS
jgi:capsular polysaccharide biosynthesis protein